MTEDELLARELQSEYHGRGTGPESPSASVGWEKVGTKKERREAREREAREAREREAREREARLEREARERQEREARERLERERLERERQERELQERREKKEREKQERKERRAREQREKEEKEQQEQKEREETEERRRRSDSIASNASNVSSTSTGTVEDDARKRAMWASVVRGPLTSAQPADAHAEGVRYQDDGSEEGDAEAGDLYVSRRVPEALPPPLLHEAELAWLRVMRPELEVDAATVAEAPMLQLLRDRVDQVLPWLMPSETAQRQRRRVLRFVRRLINETFPEDTPRLVLTGSFPLGTYLPTSDIDGSLDLAPGHYGDWHIKLMNRLLTAAGGEGTVAANPVVRSVTFINAEVLVVKMVVDNIALDISANQMGAQYAWMFLRQVGELVGDDNLFLRSMVLVKAWCQYECAHLVGKPILGSQAGFLSTYAISTMLVCIFNLHRREIGHPLHALALFIRHFDKYPWETTIATIRGPRDRASGQLLERPPHGEFLPAELLQDFQAQRAAAGPSPPVFTYRICNIEDPLCPTNNVGRSVTPGSMEFVHKAFRRGTQQFGYLLDGALTLAMVTMSNPSYPGLGLHPLPAPGRYIVCSCEGRRKKRTSGRTNPRKHCEHSIADFIDHMFLASWSDFGRGDHWRPDCLEHPRSVRPIVFASSAPPSALAASAAGEASSSSDAADAAGASA